MTTQNAKAWWLFTGGGRSQESDRKGEMFNLVWSGVFILKLNNESLLSPANYW